MKSHATRFETHVDKAERSGKLTADEAKEARHIASMIRGHEFAISELTTEFWQKLERRPVEHLQLELEQA